MKRILLVTPLLLIGVSLAGCETTKPNPIPPGWQWQDPNAIDPNTGCPKSFTAYECQQHLRAQSHG